MNNTIIVEIEPKSRWEHISILLSGLSMLSKQNKIKLLIKDKSHDKDFIYSNDAGLELTINGIKCYIDVADGYNNIDFIKKKHNDYMFYFKRSYDETTNNKYGFSNVIPLGLIYDVYDKNIKYKYPNQKIQKQLLLKIFGKKVFNQYYIDDFEYNGLYNLKKPKICFTVRLWDGDEFKELNNKRIELVRELKNRYGSRFCGGIYNTKLAQKLCPELIVNKVYTHRKNYLERMHKCDICIATTGLHNSIGFKLAEYVAAGKVILTEKLKYEVPGNFKNEVNYLEFDSVEECLNIIENLFENKKMMKELSNNNLNYYKKFLKPDMLMLRVINIVLSGNYKGV